METDLKPQTKEVFMPVNSLTSGVISKHGTHTGARLAATEICNVEMKIPWDFSVIEEMDLVVIAIASVAGGDVTVFFQSGDDGNPYNSRGGNFNYAPIVFVANEIREMSIAVLLATIIAGDYVALEILNSTLTSDIHVLGVHLKYR